MTSYIPRHELWRQGYRANRYLRRATLKVIARRSQDIAVNMLGVNEQGQLTPGRITPERQQWWVLWTHILEELSLRGQAWGSLELIDPNGMPWISAPEAPRGLRILRGRDLPSNPYLARVGQREHIIDAFERGRIRVSPAAKYSDPSLNPAIRDEELEVSVISPGDTAVIQRIDPATGQPGEPVPIIGELRYSKVLQDNFFVLCMTGEYDPRHLDDFGGDALIVIENVTRFSRRLAKAVRRVRPELEMVAAPVSYYDPYFVKPSTMIPHLWKHFRYAYQKEFRFVWVKPGLSMTEEPFFIEMGTLRDIARVYVLPRG